jgi:hypothetical protein
MLEREGVDKQDIVIFSNRPQPSPIQGAQFLHKPLRYDEEPQGEIEVVRIGTEVLYADKVYGEPKETSWRRTQPKMMAWPLIPIYERLWERWESQLIEETVTATFMEALLEGQDKVFSSVPPQAYCKNPAHTFRETRILLGKPVRPLPIPNMIVYSGRVCDQWYRMSNIFGEDGIEFGPSQALEPDAWKEEIAHHFDGDPTEGMKPLGTNCDCFMSGGEVDKGTLYRIGRFGQWDRRILLHHVEDQVRTAL